VVSALAIFSSAAPVDAFFVSVPVPDPVVAAPLAVAFVSVPVPDPVVAVPPAVAFVSVPVAVLVSAALVSAAQVHLAVSAPSYFPYLTYELSKFHTGSQYILSLKNQLVYLFFCKFDQP
jgi:hypothetical protein